MLASSALAETWKSDVFSVDLPVIIHKPTGEAPKVGYPTVIVLRGVSNGPAYANEQMLIIEVTYPVGAKIRKTGLAADILKLRRDLTAKDRTFLKDLPVDPARIFIMPEGYALKTDITFDQQEGRTMAADLMYPVGAKDVPLLVAITCDNANRMGSGSLLYCHDTLLEIGMLHGFAVAMIDHPVRPPYKGMDDLPRNRETMIKAVTTLRKEANTLGLSGKIGLMGFSRGATMAVAVAGDRELAQAALVHGNRVDYTRLLPEDKMTARFEKAWGPVGQKWVEQSAMHYLTKNSAPMFLNTSDTESPEYQLGLKQLSDKLTELGVERVHVVDKDQRGHRVTTDPERLQQIMDFFQKHLR
jgi:hypothetical protein